MRCSQVIEITVKFWLDKVFLLVSTKENRYTVCIGTYVFLQGGFGGNTVKNSSAGAQGNILGGKGLLRSPFFLPTGRPTRSEVDRQRQEVESRSHESRQPSLVAKYIDGASPLLKHFIAHRRWLTPHLLVCWRSLLARFCYQCFTGLSRAKPLGHELDLPQSQHRSS